VYEILPQIAGSRMNPGHRPFRLCTALAPRLPARHSAMPAATPWQTRVPIPG
jgi:hypothetical protein